MNNWLEIAKSSLADALKKAKDGGLPLQNLYMLAPVLYSEKQNAKNEDLIQEMIEANDQKVVADWSVDKDSKNQYKFHYVSSYLYCYVVAGKIDEMKYDRIMEYVCGEMELFIDDYTGEYYANK
ncbi:MAG: hypothetical protein V7721_09705 [Porticoccaceae bacterium]